MLSLTRFDVFNAFVRIQLLATFVNAMSSLLFSLTINFPTTFQGWGMNISPHTFWLKLMDYGPTIFSFIVLCAFGRAIAQNCAGQREQEPITSLRELKMIVVSCVGLVVLFPAVGSVLYNIAFVLYMLYDPLWGKPTQDILYQSLDPLVRIFVGFALAFGPAIRESWRARVAA